jgi:hypothetical protein
MSDTRKQARSKKARSPCMAKLDRLGWVASDWFDIEGYRLGIRSTSQPFSAWLRHTLADHEVEGPEDPDDTPIYSVVVEDGNNPTGRRGSTKFHIIYYGTWDIVRTLDIQTLAKSLLHEIHSFTYPIRDDAVFIEASVMRLDGRTVLIPALFVKPLCEIGRRLQSSLDIALPGQMSVAIDPATGDLVCPEPMLRIAPDQERVLRTLIPLDRAADPRAMIDDRVPVDLVLGWVREPHPLVRRGPRARAFYEYAKMVRNGHLVKADSIHALARLFERADYREFEYFSSRHAIDVLRAIGEGRDYDAHRTEATPAGASSAQDGSIDSEPRREGTP